MKSSDARSETEHQARLVAILDWYNVPYFAVPNGARMGRRSWQRVRHEGATPGAPDLVIGKLTADGRPVCVEMKRQGGRLSDAQKKMLIALDACGWHVIVAYGVEEAVQQLKACGVI